MWWSDEYLQTTKALREEEVRNFQSTRLGSHSGGQPPRDRAIRRWFRRAGLGMKEALQGLVSRRFPRREFDAELRSSGVVSARPRAECRAACCQPRQL